jgi:hypothetical protein
MQCYRAPAGLAQHQQLGELRPQSKLLLCRDIAGEEEEEEQEEVGVEVWEKGSYRKKN